MKVKYAFVVLFFFNWFAAMGILLAYGHSGIVNFFLINTVLMYLMYQHELNKENKK